MNHTHLWAMYFASIAAIKMHPRNQAEIDLEELAKIADRMYEITLERYKCRWDLQHS